MEKIKRNSSVLFIALAFAVSTLYGCSETKELSTKEDNQEIIAASNKGKKSELIPEQSKLEWEGKKVTGKHNGTINIISGDLTEDNGKLTGGNFVVDFNSIKVLDLQDEGMNAKLTGHLKSEDFFSAEKFPSGKFVITSAAPLKDGSDNNYTINGDLTIKGITNNISFPAKVNIGDNGITASADFNIDRTLWDIRYGSGKFFEGLGDKMINDEFNIKFKIASK
ncbi:MAG TPA: YceI family protein [Ignavibacteria bacterium]|nr:YceI family protein [Ignavibacteria bacterium]HMR39607.1 YceI family protein [Ignavibacteria bacterium]